MLADLGTLLLNAGAPAVLHLMNCQATAVMEDEDGHSLVSFKIHTDEDYLGSLIVAGKPERWAKTLAEWGGQFHAIAKIEPDLAYTTPLGERVVPFSGNIVRTLDELGRP